MKKINSLISLIAFALFLMAFTIPQDQKKPGPWEVPEKYQKMENPYKDDASLNKIGKMLWAKHCKSCHGNTGLGDGPKAKQLETSPSDFSTEEFHTQTDGVIYYKSFIGRDEMPNFESKIPDDEDRWAVVNFMRTLKK